MAPASPQSLTLRGSQSASALGIRRQRGFLNTDWVQVISGPVIFIILERGRRAEPHTALEANYGREECQTQFELVRGKD
jgi:hypothetical protein